VPNFSTANEVVLTNPISQRRVRRVSISDSQPSDTGSEDEDLKGSRARRRSRPKGSTFIPSTPVTGSTGHLKRKPQPAQAPSAKRKKSESSGNPEEDPARKYCVNKYREMIIDIFLRYPRNAQGEEIEEVGDEKERLEREARKFAEELEQCVYDNFAERDKDGRLAALGKYK
jgi:hypothetical protein